MAAVSQQQAAAPARPRPPIKQPVRTPKRLQKRTLTLTEAADQWEKSKREIDRLKPMLEEAAGVLLAHFERTGKRTYKDRIALVIRGGSLVLDQAKVRMFLGERLPEFQRRGEPSRSLSLLK